MWCSFLSVDASIAHISVGAILPLLFALARVNSRCTAINWTPWPSLQPRELGPTFHWRGEYGTMSNCSFHHKVSRKMGARSTYHVIVIHQIHLPRITLNRAHERLCSLHPLIDRRLAQSLHLCCLKSPLNAPDLQQWVWCNLGLLLSRLFSHIVVFTNHNSNHQIFSSAIDCRWQSLWSLTNGEVRSLFENSPGRCYCSKKSLLVSHMPC